MCLLKMSGYINGSSDSLIYIDDSDSSSSITLKIKAETVDTVGVTGVKIVYAVAGRPYWQGNVSAINKEEEIEVLKPVAVGAAFYLALAHGDRHIKLSDYTKVRITGTKRNDLRKLPFLEAIMPKRYDLGNSLKYLFLEPNPSCLDKTTLCRISYAYTEFKNSGKQKKGKRKR